jgi:hypothetical protein
MTSTTEQGTIAIGLNAQQWQDIVEELYMAAGNARGTDREARLWATYRTVRDVLAQQEA